MKSLIRLIFAIVLILCLLGCEDTTAKDEAAFYYPRAQLDFGSTNGIFVPEYHDVSGHAHDLRYILSLYLRGPTDQELVTPFPAGTILIELEEHNGELSVVLSSGASALESMEFITACGGLAMTCFSISDAETIHIESLPSVSGESVDITLTRDSFLLSINEILPNTTE